MKTLSAAEACCAWKDAEQQAFLQVVAVKKFRQPDQIHGSGASQRSAAQMQKRELLIKQVCMLLAVVGVADSCMSQKSGRL